jgi:hypothetical protein
MTTRTRYFVVASLLVIIVGLGTGLVAYYTGFQISALAGRGGPAELQYVPRDAAVVAYAAVHEVMTSELRQKMHQVVPVSENGQREFENQTGINIETDIDRVVACFEPTPGDNGTPGSGLVIARGRFNDTKIEALMRDHGARLETYQNKRLIVADHVAANHLEASRPTSPDSSHTGGLTAHSSSSTFAVAFIEPGLIAVGNASPVRAAIDAQLSGQNVTANDDLMNLVRSLDSGNAWAVGRFDLLQSHAKLPTNIASQIPPITWFSVSGHVNGGIRGVIRAETRDEEAANNLRDVVRGFMALAKLQTTAKPELQTMLQALELGGTGKTVALSFAVPADVFDTLSSHAGRPAVKPQSGR